MEPVLCFFLFLKYTLSLEFVGLKEKFCRLEAYDVLDLRDALDLRDLVFFANLRSHLLPFYESCGISSSYDAKASMS